MKKKIQKVVMWIVLIATAVGAFTLTLNITGEMIETTNESENIVIDLNEDPDVSATTEEQSIWERYWKYKAVSKTNTQKDVKNTTEVTEDNVQQKDEDGAVTENSKLGDE